MQIGDFCFQNDRLTKYHNIIKTDIVTQGKLCKNAALLGNEFSNWWISPKNKNRCKEFNLINLYNAMIEYYLVVNEKSSREAKDFINEALEWYIKKNQT